MGIIYGKHWLRFFAMPPSHRCPTSSPTTIDTISLYSRVDATLLLFFFAHQIFVVDHLFFARFAYSLRLQNAAIFLVTRKWMGRRRTGSSRNRRLVCSMAVYSFFLSGRHVSVYDVFLCLMHIMKMM